MKHFQEVCRFILLSVLINGFALSYSRSLSLPDTSYDLITDRPEGRLVYYDVTLKYEGARRDEKSVYRTPVVFNDKGEVFFRNLLRTSGSIRIWVKGFLNEEGKEISFPQGSVIDYEPFCSMYIGNGFSSFYTYNPFLDEGEHSREDDIKFSIDENGEISYNSLENNKWLQTVVLGLSDVGRVGRRIESLSLSPSDFKIAEPPSDILAEDYQIVFDPLLNQCPTFNEHEKFGLKLKVKRDGNTIYINGLSRWENFGDPDSWMAGEIRGDKVFFKNDQPVGINRDGKVLLLKPITFTTSTKSHLFYRTYVEYTETDDYLIFDYDSHTGELSNPNSTFIFNAEGNLLGCEISSGDGVDREPSHPVDFFDNAIISKIPVHVQVPVTPQIESNTNGAKIKCTFFDTDGYVIDPDCLFLRLKAKQDVQNEYVIREYNFDTQKIFGYKNHIIESTTELPFELLNQTISYGMCGLRPLEDYFIVIKDLIKGFITEIELVYINDGVEISSKEASGIGGVENGTIDGQQGDNIIYDLTGRRIDKENPAPGIYIRNGKKFIIR